MRNGMQRGRRIRPSELAQAQRFTRPPEPVPDDEEYRCDALEELGRQIRDAEWDAASGQERW